MALSLQLDTQYRQHAIKPEPRLVSGMKYEEQVDSDLFVPLTYGCSSIQRGILIMPAGRKRSLLEAWFSSRARPQAVFTGRILPFDERAGLVWRSTYGRRRAGGSAHAIL